MRSEHRPRGSATVVVNSPLRLTELGTRIADEIGANTWARSAADGVRSKTVGMRPDQIQEFCYKFAYEEHRLGEEMNTAVSISAYEHGVDKTQVLDVLVITLRDELLAASPSQCVVG